MTTVQSIRAVRDTLELVSVRGKRDLSRVLGCIQTLERVEREVEQLEQNDGAALQHTPATDAADTV